MYLLPMEEIGADTIIIQSFVKIVADKDIQEAHHLVENFKLYKFLQPLRITKK